MPIENKNDVKRKRFVNESWKDIKHYSIKNFDIEELKNKKKIISPFAPEASVPLPFQLKDFGNLGTTVWKRNERERYRVRCVNEGYERLRTHLPLADHERRLSKVDTLRLAIFYINHLQYLLSDENHNLKCKCFTNFKVENEILNCVNENLSASSGYE